MEKFKFEAQQQKLEGICDENSLVYRFNGSSYPIMLTIKPNNGIGEQLSLLEQSDEKGYIRPDSYIRLYFDGGSLGYEIAGRFPIDDALFNKIRLIFVRMHGFWLQYYFRTMVEQDELPEAAGNIAYDGKPLEVDEGDGGASTDDDAVVESITDEEYTYEPPTLDVDYSEE